MYFNLRKKGNKYIMSVLILVKFTRCNKLDSIDLGADLIAGLFVCAHTNKFSEEAEFSNTTDF